jgi:hypothetical protein
MNQVTRRRRLLPGLDQIALRALIPVGLLVTLTAALLAGAAPPWWEQALLLVTAGAAMVVPDSSAPALLLLGQGYLWLQAPSSASVLVLLAAAGMVTTHVTAMVAAQGPATMPVDRGAVRRWAGRGALVWAAGVPVWVLVLGARALPHARLAEVAGLMVLIVVAVGTATFISTSRDPA